MIDRHIKYVSPLIYELIDLTLLPLLLIAVYASARIGHMPEGFQNFLAMRVTLRNVALIGCFYAVWVLISRIFRLYDPSTHRTLLSQLRTVATTCFFAMPFAFVFPPVSHSGAFYPELVLVFWLAATGLLVSTRVAGYFMLRAATKPTNILIVGSGPRALKLYDNIQSEGSSLRHVIGFVDNPNGHIVPEVVSRGMLGTLTHLDRLLMTRPVDKVLIALPVKSCYDDIQRTIQVCEEVGIEAEYLSDVFQYSLAQPQYEEHQGHAVMRLRVAADDARILVKRIIDIVGAMVGLIVLGPLFALIALVIRLTSPGPALFVQERYGLNKRQFRMYKFRTMSANAEALQASLEKQNEAQGPVFKMKHDPRITPIGRFLRKTSLDELPQLINVLRGEMSVVGPRPLPFRDVSKFDAPWLMRRFSVKPGLTCLWQVNGRSNTSFDHWIAMDLKYIDSWSLSLDLKIIALTVPAVMRGSGAM